MTSEKGSNDIMANRWWGLDMPRLGFYVIDRLADQHSRGLLVPVKARSYTLAKTVTLFESVETDFKNWF